MVLAGCEVIEARQQVIIRPDEIGVVLNTETEQLETPLPPGTHTIDPLRQQVTFYPTFVQNYLFSGRDDRGDPATAAPAITATTGDGRPVSVSLSVVFRINPAEVNRIHSAWFGTPGDYRAGYIRPTTRLLTRTLISTYTLAEVTAISPLQLAQQMTEPLRQELADNGFILERVDVLRVQPD
jgi:regulator of protease activity HflC (stomatin/prohibitin superfamily)